MPHPAMDNIGWASVVNAEIIAHRVGIPFEDLRIVNQQTAPDPLTLLIQEEELNMEPVTITLTDNVKTIESRCGVRFAEDALKLFKQKAVPLNTFDISTLISTGPNDTITTWDIQQVFKSQETRGGNEKPDPSIPQPQQLTWTPEFIEFVDWYLQDMSQRMYKAAFWTASLLFAPQGDFDFTPSPEMVQKSVGISRTIGYADNNNLCAYAYNGDKYPDVMPGKRLSKKQYDMLKNSAKTVQTLYPHIKACKTTGFKVHASVVDMHNDVLVGREMNKQNKERAVRNAIEAQLKANEQLVNETSTIFD